MNVNDSFYIKVGSNNFCLINNLLFEDVNWSNQEKSSWVFIIIGIDYNDSTIYWMLQTKNSSSPKYYKINLDSKTGKNFFDFLYPSTTSFDLNIGFSNNLNGICLCNMKYFTFYFGKIVTIQDLVNMKKTISFYFYKSF